MLVKTLQQAMEKSHDEEQLEMLKHDLKLYKKRARKQRGKETS